MINNFFIKSRIKDIEKKRKESNIFFRQFIFILIVINLLLGSMTAYDKFIYKPTISQTEQ